MSDHAAATEYLKSADPRLGKVIERVGMCQLAQETRTELLPEVAKAIISQQISTKAAATIYQRFLQFYADKPITAQALLKTSPEQLRSLGISRQKTNYLFDLAQKSLHLPTLDKLAEMSDEDIIQALTQIKGVGRWTVQMLLIFCLNRPDVLPVDDLGIRKAIYKLYALDELPDRKKIQRLGQAWQPFRSIASWYLWQSLVTPVD